MRDAKGRGTDPGAESSARARARRVDAHIEEMLRLARGIIADGVVTEGETLALAGWLGAHPAALEEWPANVLASRLGAILQDGIVGPDERNDLSELLHRVLGEDRPVTEPSLLEEIPFDDPFPAVEFDDRVFVFAGRFAHGTRRACELIVQSLGGLAESAVEPHTDYLVVGGLTAHDWGMSEVDAALKAVVEQRDAGSRTAVIPEHHWSRALP